MFCCRNVTCDGSALADATAGRAIGATRANAATTALISFIVFSCAGVWRRVHKEFTENRQFAVRQNLTRLRMSSGATLLTRQIPANERLAALWSSATSRWQSRAGY